ncbi:hypothetical protein [Xanthomonas translucens]|uniref:hypothetical protein n=1 Tax=Xanthomonas campestris pv. translucens TaxID=343 RepID=UPI00114D202C|nr:hypothetical protein [Xanthomonas translucens]QSQ51502.1 hypothetical protein ISN36_11935 [Xanthomonas translucens pv. undulosa]WLA07591.1 hypothetical protein MO328_14380 [Xanthomonas translucens]
MKSSTVGARKMIRFLLAAIFSLPLVLHAKESSCGNSALKEASKPLYSRDFTFCFLFTTPEEGVPTDPAAISVYYSSGKTKPVFLYELPYSGTESRIEDAFLVPTDGGERLAIIHSSDTPSTFEIVSQLYDVTVIDIGRNPPSLNETAKHFFDFGGDFADANGKVIYKYPYKTRDTVIAALKSKIFGIGPNGKLAATVKDKALLYPEPNSREKTKSYLIQGDKVSVEDATSGWCKIRFQAKAKQIVKWMDCSSLELK